MSETDEFCLRCGFNPSKQSRGIIAPPLKRKRYHNVPYRSLTVLVFFVVILVLPWVPQLNTTNEQLGVMYTFTSQQELQTSKVILSQNSITLRTYDNQFDDWVSQFHIQLLAGWTVQVNVDNLCPTCSLTVYENEDSGYTVYSTKTSGTNSFGATESGDYLITLLSGNQWAVTVGSLTVTAYWTEPLTQTVTSTTTVAVPMARVTYVSPIQWLFEKLGYH